MKSGILVSDLLEDDEKERKTMALIKCKECGKDISETAENCPHCGDRTAYGRSATEAKLLRIEKLFAATMLLIGLVLIIVNGLQSIGLYMEWDDRGRYYEDYSFISYCKDIGERETLNKTIYGVLFLVFGASNLYTVKDKMEELGEVSRVQKKQPTPTSVRQAKAAPASGWKCADCGEINEEQMDKCQYCGSTKNFSVSQKK